MRVHLKQRAALEAPVQDRDPGKLKQAQKRDSQMVWGLEPTMYEKPLKGLGFFNLEKTKNESNCSLPQTKRGAIQKTDSSESHTAEEQEAMDMTCSKENSF